jgi:RES domain-containing protein
MIVYRLGISKYCKDLSGKGSERYGGRWNSKGNAVVYTSQSRALAVVELAVHIPSSIIPTDLKLVTIEIPDEISVYQVGSDSLHSDWKLFPHHFSTKKIGDSWIRQNEHLLMKAPSAVVEGDFNILINPGNPDFSQVKIVNVDDFVFDGRLFKKYGV